MDGEFDPYHKWLGIPRQEQPPHHYRLLGIPLFESDRQVIQTAADRQMVFLRQFQSGEHGTHARQLLNSVARARLDLLKPEVKAAYDASLNQQLSPSSVENVDAAIESEVLDIDSDATPQFGRSKRQSSGYGQLVGVVGGALTAALIVWSIWYFGGNGKPADRGKVAQVKVAVPEESENSPKGSDEEQSGSGKSKVQSRDKRDQSRPLATGDEAPWPTLNSKPASKSKKINSDDTKRSTSRKPAQGKSKTDAQGKTEEAAEMPAEGDLSSSPEIAGSLVSNRRQVPDQAAQEAAKKKLKELFSLDYAQAKKQEGKISLAKILFEKGQESEADPAACFVMLSEAGDLAAEAGQLGLSWDSLVALGNRFEVNHLPMMERAAKTASPYAKSFEEVHELMRMYTDLTNEAIRVNDFDTASKVMQAAAAIVRKPLYANLKDQVALAGKRVSLLREAYDVAKPAQEKLQTHRTDPVACLAWGRFLCFYKNDWETGLPLLALSVDPVYGPLAQRENAISEMSPPPESQDYATLADDWWAAAENEKEPARSMIREHAAKSYFLAQGSVSGLEKAALEQKADRIFGATKFIETLGDSTGITIAPPELNPGPLFTIEFWVSTRAQTGPLVSKRHNEGGESSCALWLDSGMAMIASNADGHWRTAKGKTSINDGAWHHVAGVRLGDQLLLFVDGKKEGQVQGLQTFASKSPWKAGTALGDDHVAARFCRIRLSNTPRYLISFTPEKQYGKDAATIFPK